MIECRFSLDLTKNGIQKTIYAKAGEKNARQLVVTLTQNGKVYDLENHMAIVFLDTGENFDAEIVNNSVCAVIPNAFPESQIRMCELRISYNNSVIYSPMFELIFEESLGNNAEGESLQDGVQYIIVQEHNKNDSHTISMVKNLREVLNTKASIETVAAYYEEMHTAFAERDKNLDEYAQKTDTAIENVEGKVNQYNETTNRRLKSLEGLAHDHLNLWVLDGLEEINGKLSYNGVVLGAGGGSDGGSGGGVSPVVKIEEIEGGHRITITDIDGSKRFDVLDGYTPIKGVDYFTDTDKTEIANAVLDALETAEGGLY